MSPQRRPLWTGRPKASRFRGSGRAICLTPVRSPRRPPSSAPCGPTARRTRRGSAPPGTTARLLPDRAADPQGPQPRGQPGVHAVDELDRDRLGLRGLGRADHRRPDARGSRRRLAGGRLGGRRQPGRDRRALQRAGHRGRHGRSIAWPPTPCSASRRQSRSARHAGSSEQNATPDERSQGETEMSEAIQFPEIRAKAAEQLAYEHGALERSRRSRARRRCSTSTGSVRRGLSFLDGA